MNAEQFVDVIRKVVTESSVKGIESILESPPGRKPRKDLLEMSAYYNERTDEEKEVINKIIRLSVDNAVFGFLCVLDGVRAIEDEEEKGTLSLIYKKDEEVILNKGEDLHDYYKAV
ncbi:hypothetical protein RF240_05655 [Dickeya dadantii]|uniref:hypothetical protein n=1 Tax=Dickeya dadantii TaxID=204038 RepID=UPI0014955F34|nr:hypothetical protein [Dickeya dadantii]NPE50583.1 hypothetical protein [Dickeya dadantii]